MNEQNLFDDIAKGGPVRVLLIEDDKEDYLLTVGMLRESERTRFEVDWQQKVPEALEQLCSARHDVCLLDYQLGEKTGLDVLREAAGRGCSIPIILLTGLADPEIDMAAMQAGAADFLRKDQIRPELLERSIRYAIQQKKIQEQRFRLLAEKAGRVQAEAAARVLTESEMRYRTMGETIPFGFWQCDPTGAMQFLSPSFLELIGMEAREAYGFGWWSALGHEGRGLRGFFQETLESGGDLEMELHLTDRQGEPRTVLMRGRPVYDEHEQITGWVGINLDLTARKRIEQQLVELNDTLEAQVAERTAVAEQRAVQLRLMAAELTYAEQRERRRLAEMLHDYLQQLLVAAKLQAGLLKRRRPEDITASVNQIEDLLDQSIDASRTLAIELSPPILHQTGLIAALEWLARWMGEKHGLEVDLQLQTQEEPEAEDVRMLLFQSVREMLFNVVRHAGVREARLMVSSEGERLRLEVSDRGRGFEPDGLKLQRGELDQFGLHTMRERIGLMGGEMSIESTPGKGTRVTVTAPILSPGRKHAPKHAEAPPAKKGDGAEGPAPRRRAGEKIRVLVAEDQKMLREGLVSLLRQQPDIDVVGEAADGETAVELARREQPDIVIMDISMPRLNGIEATRRIIREMPYVQVIGLSMHEEEAMAKTMRSAGARVFLTKGGPSEDLIAAIRGE